MRINALKLWVLIVAMTVVGLTACSKSAERQGNIEYIKVNSIEPQSLLIPADTNELGGGRVIAALFSGLMYYDKHGQPHNDLAQSISSSDQQHYLVELKDEIKFSDGTPIKAEHFVKAWNYAVEHKLKLMSFYQDINGYQAVKDGRARTMQGLKVIDDKTFTIELTGSVADFQSRLGYNAFFPLPDVAYEDINSYGQQPVSSGPYKIVSWLHDREIAAVPNEFYIGPRQAQNAGIKFVLYAKTAAAYADVMSGQLDVLDAMPEEQVASFRADFGSRAINQASAENATLRINVNSEHFKMDEEGLLRRRALSLAINREQIVKVILAGVMTAAKDFTSPAVVGHNPSLPGNDVLSYQPQKAKRLWQQADKIKPFSGTLSIAYNADSYHRGWVEAVLNQWKNVLGVKVEGKPYPDFKSLRQEVKNHQVKSVYRGSWLADYPSAFNFLQPLFHSDAVVGSNDAEYKNPQVDTLLALASTAQNQQQWQGYIDAVQEILLQELPNIPLWYKNAIGVYSKNVTDVVVGWDGVPLYYRLKKTDN